MSLRNYRKCSLPFLAAHRADGGMCAGPRHRATRRSSRTHKTAGAACRGVLSRSPSSNLESPSPSAGRPRPKKISTQRSRSPHRGHRACSVSFALRPQEFCSGRSVFSLFKTRWRTGGTWPMVCAKAHFRLPSSYQTNKKRKKMENSARIYEKTRFEATTLLKTKEVDLERTQIRTQFQVERTQLWRQFQVEARSWI